MNTRSVRNGKWQNCGEKTKCYVIKKQSKIAKALGIKKRVDATNIIQNTQMNVDIATASTPLYYLGIEALTAEINILQHSNRVMTPSSPGLRDFQERACAAALDQN